MQQNFCLRRKKYVHLIMILLCMSVIGFWHHHHRFSNTLESSTCSDKETQLESSKSNRTGQLWNFGNDGLEKLYLYKELLTKKHTFNLTNTQMFRKELRLSLKSFNNSNFIIDQQSAPVGYKIKIVGTRESSKFTITEDIYKLLIKDGNFGDVPRCSIIGNSGLLLDSNCGKYIDKADYVFRCNAAPILPFEADAGSKSNLTTFNPSILHKRYNNLSSLGSRTRFLNDMKEYHGLLWAPCFNFKALRLCTELLKSYNLTENNLVLGHPHHFKQVQSFWKSHGFKKRLTTGFYLVSAALSHCRELHLYGFWPFFQEVDTTIKEVPYHYFEKLEYRKGRIHDMNSEFATLVQLHVRGVLKMHVGKCT